MIVIDGDRTSARINIPIKFIKVQVESIINITSIEDCWNRTRASINTRRILTNSVVIPYVRSIAYHSIGCVIKVFHDNVWNFWRRLNKKIIVKSGLWQTSTFCLNRERVSCKYRCPCGSRDFKTVSARYAPPVGLRSTYTSNNGGGSCTYWQTRHIEGCCKPLYNDCRIGTGHFKFYWKHIIPWTNILCQRWSTYLSNKGSFIDCN